MRNFAVGVVLFAALARAGSYVSPEFGIDAPPTPGPAYDEQRDVAVAFGGGNYFAVWTDERSGGLSEIFGARFKPDGTPLDPSGLRLAGGGRTAEYPHLGFDGTNFLLVYTLGTSSLGYEKLVAVRLDITGH